jgi:hypothetical protein
MTRPGRLLAVNVTASVLLLIQYLLGMVVDVYIVLPARHPGAGAGNYFTGAAAGLAWVVANGPGWAAAHAVLGMVLAAAALGWRCCCRCSVRWPSWAPGSTGPAS